MNTRTIYGFVAGIFLAFAVSRIPRLDFHLRWTDPSFLGAITGILIQIVCGIGLLASPRRFTWPSLIAAFLGVAGSIWIIYTAYSLVGLRVGLQATFYLVVPCVFYAMTIPLLYLTLSRPAPGTKIAQQDVTPNA
jgi:peptidoglycan/LPS O-acetylase OafA/YrhL